MPRKRSRAKTGDVDDVVVFPVSALTDQDDAEVAVRELFTRAGNIADERLVQLPASARLIDSNGVCVHELSLGYFDDALHFVLARSPSEGPGALSRAASAFAAFV